TTAMLGPALGDHGLDTAFAQRATMSGGIVAAIGVDDAGLLKRSATNAANGWNRINERQQLRDVVGVRASQDRNE
ncbi:transposase, partial [Burkholderia glumae]